MKNATVTAVTETFHGHHQVQLDNGHAFSVHRGEPLPAVGDEYKLVEKHHGGIHFEKV